MTINSLDTSNYFKGLLILAGREKKITQNEKIHSTFKPHTGGMSIWGGGYK